MKNSSFRILRAAGALTFAVVAFAGCEVSRVYRIDPRMPAPVYVGEPPANIVGCKEVGKFNGSRTTDESSEEVGYNVIETTTTSQDSISSSVARGLIDAKDPRAFACDVELDLVGDFEDDDAFIGGKIAVPQ